MQNRGRNSSKKDEHEGGSYGFLIGGLVALFLGVVILCCIIYSNRKGSDQNDFEGGQKEEEDSADQE